jgi:hypothetical protein
MAVFDLNGPAISAPEGAVQDLDNPPNHNNAVIAVYTACLVIMAAFVALRLYAKIVFLKLPELWTLRCSSFYPS